MRIKILTILSVILLFSGCKKNTENTSNETIKQNSSHALTQKDIEGLDYTEYNTDVKVDSIIQDWDGYLQLQDVIDNVKKGDLTFFNDNKKGIILLLKALKKNIPDEVKAASIEARQLVVETKLYKLESLSNLSTTNKKELLVSIQEFLVAFSNLNLQMNKKIDFDTRVIEKP